MLQVIVSLFSVPGWTSQPEEHQVTCSLGLQVHPQKVFGPSKPTPNTFSEGTWSPRGYVPSSCQLLQYVTELEGSFS